MEEKFIVAIEIGSSKIRGALASLDSDNQINVLAVQEERHTDSVRYGQVKNIEEVSNKIDSICRKLENCKALQPRKIDALYIGLSGNTVIATPASQTIDFDEETDITAAIIEDLKNRVKASRFNDKDTYAILPINYLVDNEATTNPVGRRGRVIRGNFCVIEGSPVIKSNINRVVNERLQKKTAGFIVSAAAEAETLLTNEEKLLGSAFVDFGAETTAVVIYKGGALRALVTLPMGGRNITRDIMSLNYLEEQAEAIKQATGIAGTKDGDLLIANPHQPEPGEVSNYIQARAAEIVANVMAQIDYAGFKTSDLPAGIVIAGGGAHLKGLTDMIAEQTKMKTRMGIIPSNIRISDPAVASNGSIDVISLLLAAMREGAVECTVAPVAPTPEPADIEREMPSAPRYYEDEDDIRIGQEIDDGILQDDPDDPGYAPKPKSKFWGINKGPKKEKTDNKRNEPIEPKEEDEETTTNSITNRIRRKITDFFKDDIDDSFEEE